MCVCVCVCVHHVCAIHIFQVGLCYIGNMLTILNISSHNNYITDSSEDVSKSTEAIESGDSAISMDRSDQIGRFGRSEKCPYGPP